MNESNKNLKKKIREMVYGLLRDYDPDYDKNCKVVVSVLNTNKSNTTPAYNTNIGHRYINISLDDKFITSIYVSKKEWASFSKKQVLSFIGHHFIKAYKETILERIADDE